MVKLRGLVVLVVLALAGCGIATTQAGNAPAETGIEAGTTVELDFTAETLEGERFEGASLAGTPTVLWFWAPWCPTCRAQIPTVSGLGEEYDGRVNVVGVGGLDSQEEIESLAGQIDNVTHLVDDEGAVWQHFRVTAQGTYTVIDADGEVVHEGYLDHGAIEELVASLAG